MAAPPPPPPMMKPRLSQTQNSVDDIASKLVGKISEPFCVNSLPTYVHVLLGILGSGDVEALCRTTVQTLEHIARDSWEGPVAFSEFIGQIRSLVQAIKAEPAVIANPTATQQLRSLLTLTSSHDRDLKLCGLQTLNTFASKGTLQRNRLKKEKAIALLMGVLQKCDDLGPITLAGVQALSTLVNHEMDLCVSIGQLDSVELLLRLAGATLGQRKDMFSHGEVVLSEGDRRDIVMAIACALGGLARPDELKPMFSGGAIDVLLDIASQFAESAQDVSLMALKALTTLGTTEWCDEVRTGASEELVEQIVIKTLSSNVNSLLNVLSMVAPGASTPGNLVAAELFEMMCKGSDDAGKCRLGRHGVVGRVIALCQPESLGGGGDVTVQEAAVHALLCLVTVDELSARVILRGGLWPLFRHTHSENARLAMLASRTLKTIGISSLEDLLMMWHSHKTRSEQIDNLYHVLKSIPQITLQEIVADGGTELFDPSNLLGEGAFGLVYAGTYKGKKVAVKRLKEHTLTNAETVHEITTQSIIPPHENIIHLYGASVPSPSCVCLILERGGTPLSSLLRPSAASTDVSPVCKSWSLRLQIALDIAKGMHHLHSMVPAVLHLDLKSNNILVTDDFRAKVCDFGLSKVQRLHFDFLNPGNTGTLQYMAPEVMLATEYGWQADVYSFGILLLELSQPGKMVFHEVTNDVQNEIRRLVVSGDRPRLGEDGTWPEGFADLIRQCWRQNPKERPRFGFTFDEDSAHPQVDITTCLSNIIRQYSLVRVARVSTVQTPMKIRDYLYIGRGQDARDIGKLESLGISAVLNMAPVVVATGRAFYPDTFDYLEFHAQDVPEYDISVHFQEAHEFICRARDAGKAVFVHCFAGASRSVTVMLAHLMKETQRPFAEVYEEVQAVYPLANINDGFRRILASTE